MSWHIYVTRYGDIDWFLVFMIFPHTYLQFGALLGAKHSEINGAPTSRPQNCFRHGVHTYKKMYTVQVSKQVLVPCKKLEHFYTHSPLPASKQNHLHVYYLCLRNISLPDHSKSSWSHCPMSSKAMSAWVRSGPRRHPILWYSPLLKIINGNW